MMRKNRRQGFTLIETIITVAIVAIAAGALLIMFSGRKHENGMAAYTSLMGAMQTANGTAKGAAGGATLVIEPSNDGEYQALVFAGTPGNGFSYTKANGSVNTVVPPFPIAATLSIASGSVPVTTATPISVFVSHFGDATVMNWDPSGGSTPAISDCAGTLQIGLTSGGKNIGSIRMHCGDSTFVPYDANGNPYNGYNGTQMSG